MPALWPVTESGNSDPVQSRPPATERAEIWIQVLVSFASLNPTEKNSSDRAAVPSDESVLLYCHCPEIPLAAIWTQWNIKHHNNIIVIIWVGVGGGGWEKLAQRAYSMWSSRSCFSSSSLRKQSSHVGSTGQAGGLNPVVVGCFSRKSLAEMPCF